MPHNRHPRPRRDTRRGPCPLPQLRTPRAGVRRPASHRLHRRWPATVWLCTHSDFADGTGPITTWLLTAVIKIVTTYTRPGQRVLLLAATPGTQPSAARSSTAVPTRSTLDPYGGLLEAAQTVTRLGRAVQTRTAGPHPDPADHHADPPPGPEPDRFDLIITAAGPQTLDQLRPTDQTALLHPGGILAVITDGERSAGRFTDPAGQLQHAAHHAGLSYLDRITLLHAVADPHVCAYADLFVFTRRTGLVDVISGRETSDA